MGVRSWEDIELGCGGKSWSYTDDSTRVTKIARRAVDRRDDRKPSTPWLDDLGKEPPLEKLGLGALESLPPVTIQSMERFPSGWTAPLLARKRKKGPRRCNERDKEARGISWRSCCARGLGPNFESRALELKPRHVEPESRPATILLATG